MARTKATLSDQPRVADYLSTGLLARVCPREAVERVLASHGKSSQRQRDLPAHAVVYYVIALTLYMGVAYIEVLRCVLEGLQWLRGPGRLLRIPSKSGISQARSRLSWEPLATLSEELVHPIATARTRGAWYRGLRLVSLDGSTLEVADETANAAAFGYPGVSRGQAAFPLIRLVGLLENGTRVLYGTRMGPYSSSEHALAGQVIASLSADVLCMADRNFYSYELWGKAQAQGGQLLWRIKKNARLPREQELSDGSFLSTIYPSVKARRHSTDGLRVRVIEYHLEGIPDAEPLYRLLTTLLDDTQAPATELAALYHERWQIETALDEFKTHLKGSALRLRSKTPDLVRQEFHGMLLAYFIVRSLIHEAALEGDADPHDLSFVHAVRVIRRKLPMSGAVPP